MTRHAMTFLVLGAALTSAAICLAGDPTKDDLAARCEAVKWTTPPEGSSEMLPPGLRAIADELVAQGPGALAKIEASLAKSTNLRRLAPDVVAHWPCDKSRAILLTLLADRDEHAAQFASYSLGEVGGSEVVRPLVDAGLKRAGMVRHNALGALAGLGAANKGFDLIVVALGDRNSWMRWSAVQALEHLDREDKLDDAIAHAAKMAASERDPGARAAAQRTLRVLKARKG